MRTTADAEVTAGHAVRIRAARPADLRQTAALHARHLPGGFFVHLGQRFLAQYHASFLAGASARMLVAEDDRQQVIGFLVGTTDNARHVRAAVRRPPPRAVAAAVLTLASNPRLLWRFLRTRVGRYTRAVARAVAARRRPASGGPSATRPVPTIGVLTHVAVDDAARGTGAGAALVEAFVAEARIASTDELRLVTSVNGGASGFYRHLGWGSRGTRRASDGTVVEEFSRRP